MGYREVAVEEIKEVLRLWLGLAVQGCPRRVCGRSPHAGVVLKTVRRYIEAARAAGLTRDAGHQRCPTS